MGKINQSEVTPRYLYWPRRKFLAAIGALAVGNLFFGACRGPGSSLPPESAKDELTPFDSITNYNNFYEFSLQKEDVASLARNFKTSPWEVTVGGLVRQP